MFGGDNNMIYGVSESCYQSFGIPASLTSGTHRNFDEFTIDLIFPDLLQRNKADLKLEPGLDITIDTSSLPQNFLIGRDDIKDNDQDEYIACVILTDLL